jgi:hypothetical protein
MAHLSFSHRVTQHGHQKSLYLSLFHPCITSLQKLIARPDEGEGRGAGSGIDSETGKKPITYIHAKEADEFAWTDWIVVIQVRSSAGGSVSRVAKEVGTFLKHALPPLQQPLRVREEEDEDQEVSTLAAEKEVTSIEDFLVQPSSLAEKRARRVYEEETVAPKVKVEEEKKTPWRPKKIISREAQDGLRVLHSSDPEKWNRKALAETFRISPNSVRRILSSKWKPTGKTIGRQNRRAMEREQQHRIDMGYLGSGSRESKEEAEIASIRREMEGKTLEENELEEEEYTLEGEEEDNQGQRHTQPVFYEGLVDPGDDRKTGRGKSGVSRGDGEWCLVDAGWCIVHVMTAQARNMYDVESVVTRAAKANAQTLQETVA